MTRPTPIGRRLLLGAGAAAFATPAIAYPDRPVRIISPFNPGGVNDIVARALAPPLSAVLRQPVLVENRAGAGGSVGAATAARAAPDGYTLLLSMVDIQAINLFTYRSLPYDPERDFVPISFVTHVPVAIVAGPSRPRITSYAALVEAARADPGGLSFASWGVGSTAHLAFARVARDAGLDFLHVPFTGQAPATQAVMAAQVDVMAVPAGGAEAMARDGNTRILAVAAPERLEMLPAVPTLAECGLEMVLSLWQGLYAPARTSAGIVGQLNAAAREAMQAESFVQVLRAQAGRPEPGAPEALAAMEQRERAAWGSIVREIGVRLE